MRADADAAEGGVDGPANACPVGDCPGDLSCVNGLCTCPVTSGLTACGTACVDIKHDRKHCGNCSTSCDGCAGGRCAKLIYSAAEDIDHFTIDDNWLYVSTATDGVIRRMPKSGGGTSVILATGQSGRPNVLGSRIQVVSDGTDVYWNRTSNDPSLPVVQEIRKVSREGGTPVSVGVSDILPLTLIAGGSGVYWTAYNAGVMEVWGITSPGGVAKILTSGLIYGYALAADKTSVYYVEGLTSQSQNNVMKLPVAGGAATQIATGTGPTNIGVGPNAVYFSSTLRGESGIRRVALTGGPIANLMLDGNVARRLAVDSSGVYAATSSAIMKVAEGGTLSVLPVEYAVDVMLVRDGDPNLYWQYGKDLWSTAKDF
jgi:hypothetical protein